MHIVIPADYQQAVKNLRCFQLLDGHTVTILSDYTTDVEMLAAQFAKADALVLIRERTKISEELLSRLPGLKLISQTGKVAGHLDLAACTKYKVAVAEGEGSPIAPAELTWSLIMNARRQLPQAMEAMKKGLWQTNIGTALHGQLIGIWGYGKIGKLIARYANAFGMDVLIWGSEKSLAQAAADGYAVAQTKADFFSSVDILTLHLRLSSRSFGIVKATDLALMKQDALIVNTSRAELIEEDALVQAMQAGRPGFAAVDVYEEEPVINPTHPLLLLPQVLCTPHLGFTEKQTYEKYFSKAFENILAFAKGNPVNIANPEVL